MTLAVSAPPMATASPLLALPGELRNRIVSFYFTHEPALAPPSISRSPLALPLTCRQLYNETYSLAFLATTFRVRHWIVLALRTRLQRVRPAFHSQIKRLELTVAVAEFVSRRCSLHGLQFADAGLTGLEELYIKYEEGTRVGSKALIIFSNLRLLLWRTVASCGNENLRKICIAHGGLIPYEVVELHHGMESSRPRSLQPLHAASSAMPSDSTQHAWKVKPYFEDGQHHFSIYRMDGPELREVMILMGRTVREAESYHQVRQELLEGKILFNVIARQPNCVDAADLDPNILVYEIDQLSRDFHLPTAIDTDAYY